jgi:acyl-CoA synthetase (AMP-forming)/AMP-acid ligase II
MAWTSPYGPIDGDGTTLVEMVVEAAAGRADRVALVDGPSGAAVGYGLLRSRIGQVAAGLGARGFGGGDVLALWAPNLPQWAGVALGAMAAGGAVTGLSPACSEDEARVQLADAGVSVLVTVPPLRGPARAAAAAAGVRDLVVLGGGDHGGDHGGDPGTDPGVRVTPIAELIASGSAVPAPAVDPATAVAMLPYSSGTTGLPKAVQLTHANLVASVRQILAGLRLTERDVVLALAPFSHVMGFVPNLAAPLAAGATVVTVPRLDLARYLALAERHRATVLIGAPPLMAALAGHPLVDAHDLSSIELIVSGGAPLGADAQRAVAARFPGAAVGQGWGMTETSVGGTVPDRDTGTVPGSVGRVMPSTELRVVDPSSGRDLAAGERGELWLRGPQVTPGYRGRPDATAELIGADGWLRTGDLGAVDADGNVFVVDRLKELIKVSGYQVPPAELEALLRTHPAVLDAAVIPRPDARRGEVPVAVVVPRGEVDPDELLAWVAARVAPYKRLRAVRFADAIPRTPSGKILRRVLRDHDRHPV